MLPIHTQIYSSREIAAAASVDEALVREAMGDRSYLGHAEALALALRLRRAARRPAGALDTFALFADRAPRLSQDLPRRTPRARDVPFAVSGAAHILLISGVILFGSFPVAPAATAGAAPAPSGAQMVFLDLPGPGGGGGGGGQLQPAPPPAARRTGTRTLRSPIPDAAPAPSPTDPAPLAGERFPVLNAPVMPSPSDANDRTGVLDEVATADDSRGAGAIDGTGAGSGRGLGDGTGSGIGDGAGGGTGGGPDGPGSGVTPPRLRREVKATYTEQARQAGLTGEVVLEVIVLRDGTVGPVRVRHGLGAGLDERAIAAVRQWLFVPATRRGMPVDVSVEIAVEFSLK